LRKGINNFRIQRMGDSRKNENSGTRNDDGTNITFIEKLPCNDSEREGKGQLYTSYPSAMVVNSPRQPCNKNKITIRDTAGTVMAQVYASIKICKEFDVRTK